MCPYQLFFRCHFNGTSIVRNSRVLGLENTSCVLRRTIKVEGLWCPIIIVGVKHLSIVFKTPPCLNKFQYPDLQVPTD